MADTDSYGNPKIEHNKHQRYRRLSRVRHSRQFENFLTVEAARLGTSTTAIFAYLDTNTAAMIRAASSTAALSTGEKYGH
jgi:hypothetical protein